MNPGRSIDALRGVEWELDESTGCWNWLGPKTDRGYGHAHPHRRYYMKAHSVVLTADKHLHHRCHNPSCVNPDHLAMVDKREHLQIHHLTDDYLSLGDVREIRRLGTIPGVRCEDVMARFGISKNSVRRYWAATSWKPELGEDHKVLPTRECPGCGAIFNHRRRDAAYCSQECQQRAWGKRQRGTDRRAA